MRKTLLAIFFILYSASSYAIDKIDESLIAQANKHLQHLNQVMLYFTQTALNGQEAKGVLMISKPKKFRCQYDDNYPLLIVGNNNTLYIYDYDLKQYSYDRIDNNGLFVLLTNNNIGQIPNLEITKTQKLQDHFVVFFKDKEKEQIITMSFSYNAIDFIKALSIEEANGNIIQISFDKIVTVKSFSESLFRIQNPKIFGEPKKLKY